MKKSIQQIRSIVIGSVLSSVVVSLSAAAPAVDGGADELVKKLDSESYLERTEAQAELGKWLTKANKSQVDALKDFSDKTDSPEVRERLRDAIDSLTYQPVPNTKGFMGIQMKPINGVVIIANVVKGQAAAEAGLKPGDWIIELEGNDLTKMNRNPGDAREFLHEYVKSKKQGEKLELKLSRNGKILEKELKLGNYEEYQKKNKLRLHPRMQQLEFNIIPDPNGRLNVIPKQLELEKLEEKAKRQKAVPPKLEKKPAKPTAPKK